MTQYICPTGTSIARSPRRQDETLEAFADRIEAKITEDLKRAGGDRTKFLTLASAEANGLVRAGCSPEDRVLLLASDTDDGFMAAERLAELVRNEFGSECNVKRVNGLRVDAGTSFRQQGVSNLIRAAQTATAAETQHKTVFNVSGGFKSVVPYMTLLGMFLGVEVVYVFETSDLLIRLPPLPVRWDEEHIAPALPGLSALAAAEMMTEEAFLDGLAPELRGRNDLLDLLIERADGWVSPSAAGRLAIDALTRDIPLNTVWLHTRALRGSGFDHARTPSILAAMRLPGSFSAPVHCMKIQSLDHLRVWKTGVGLRLVYWQEESDVFVAEALNHADYDELRRVGANRADYHSAGFSPWIAAAPADPGDAVGEAFAGAIADFASETEALTRESDELRERVAQQDASAQRLKRHASGLEQQNKKLQRENDSLQKDRSSFHQRERLVFEALAFATEAHRTHARKDADSTPYVNHLVEVAHILRAEALVHDPEVAAAALLHDSIEDAGITADELKRRFGKKVASLVKAVSDDKSLPKDTRKQLQTKHAPHASAEVAFIKLADKIANLRDLVRRPPAKWSAERRDEYVRWAGEVVDALPAFNGSRAHLRLRQLFEQAKAACEAVKETPTQSETSD